MQQWWIEIFLVAKKNNVEDAIEFFDRCLVWRKNFDVESKFFLKYFNFKYFLEITTYNLNNTVVKNFIYFHGCDLNDCDISKF